MSGEFKLVNNVLNYFSTYYTADEKVRAWVGNMDFVSTEEEFKKNAHELFEKVTSNHDCLLIVYSEIVGKLCVATNKNYTPFPSLEPIREPIRISNSEPGQVKESGYDEPENHMFEAAEDTSNAAASAAAVSSVVNFFFVETQDTLSERDRVHRCAVTYFIKENIFPKSLLEDDSGEEYIFGDDELGFL